MPKITTFLTYDGRVEEAVNLYCSAFKNSKITSLVRYGEHGPGPKGEVMTCTFQLDGQTFMALNGGPTFTFSQGISLFVSVETQAELDALWAKLTDGGREVQCGWLTDRFGVSWQIIPTMLSDVLNGKDKAGSGRAMKAMLGMKKLDIAALQKAYDGT